MKAHWNNILILAMGLFVATSGMDLAQDQGEAKFKGRVTAVNVSGQSITIRCFDDAQGKGTTKTFSVPNETPIKVQGNPESLAEVKVRMVAQGSLTADGTTIKELVAWTQGGPKEEK